MGKLMPLLLDSSHMVSLILQNYFNSNLRLYQGPVEGSETEAQNVFDKMQNSQILSHTEF